MLGIQKARESLSTLVLNAANDLTVTVISVNGHPQAAIVPVDRKGVAFVPPPTDSAEADPERLALLERIRDLEGAS